MPRSVNDIGTQDVKCRASGIEVKVLSQKFWAEKVEQLIYFYKSGSCTGYRKKIFVGLSRVNTSFLRLGHFFISYSRLLALDLV